LFFVALFISSCQTIAANSFAPSFDEESSSTKKNELATIGD
jgi:hypothetical protein